MNAALAAARLDRERRARVKAGPSEVPQGAGSSVGNVGNAENDATLFFSFFFVCSHGGCRSHHHCHRRPGTRPIWRPIPIWGAFLTWRPRWATPHADPHRPPATVRPRSLWLTLFPPPRFTAAYPGLSLRDAQDQRRRAGSCGRKVTPCRLLSPVLKKDHYTAATITSECLAHNQIPHLPLIALLIS